MANPNGLVMMPTHDNRSLTLLAKPGLCHEGKFDRSHLKVTVCKIRVGLHRHVAKIATTYIFIVSCFSTLDVSLYFNIANYYLPSQRKH